MLSAWYLASEGIKVTLLERGESGKESSWAGGGIISPLYPWRYAEPVTRLARWSQAHFPDLATVLHQQSGVDPEYLPSGLLMLDLDEQERQQAQQWADAQQYALSFPATPELPSIQSGLGERNGHSIWMEQVGQVRNPRLLQALRGAIVQLGVNVLEHHPVDTLLTANNQVQGVISNGKSLHADKVVLCTGAWTDQLLERDKAGIYPVRGQMLLYQAPTDLLQRIILADDNYFIPRKDGRILVGSTMEEVGFDKTTTLEARQQLEQRAAEVIPGLTDYPIIAHWAGLRPGRASGIPCVSEHPEIRGLFINAGHFRNGVVTGPAAARLLADLVLQQTPIIDPADYRLKC